MKTHRFARAVITLDQFPLLVTLRLEKISVAPYVLLSDL